MAKKKVITRRSRVSTGTKNDPIDIKLDFEDFNEMELDEELEEEYTIEEIVLKPAGYPLKINDTHEITRIRVGDEELFQAYAQDQWAGLSGIHENEYLFDQMLIPDFAFKVVKIKPKGAHKITTDTRFILQNYESAKTYIEKVSFDDIVGQQQAKEKCKIIIESLKHPEKFGYWMPRNILFYGEPGTGKTLTAKALASETNLKMYAVKGTSLIGLHVGDGANKIHSLFEEARENAPSIIFIDELDAIGLSRSYQAVRGDVVEVSTALLAEMDGMNPNLGVITIGATNNIDLLDPGLRSRFEEEIEFKLPNFEERIELLKMYLSKTDIPVEVDYRKVSAEMEMRDGRGGFSGRDIKEKIVKSAVYDVILGKTDKITTEQLISIIRKLMKNRRNPNLYT